MWEDNYRVYGARKLWKAAQRAGHDVGRDQIARWMRVHVSDAVEVDGAVLEVAGHRITKISFRRSAQPE